MWTDISESEPFTRTESCRQDWLAPCKSGWGEGEQADHFQSFWQPGPQGDAASLWSMNYNARLRQQGSMILFSPNFYSLETFLNSQINPLQQLSFK